MSRRSSAATLAAGAILGACSPGTPAPGTTGRAAPQPPLATGPISYFERHCARCHGPYGELYPRPFAAHTDEELARIVREMVTGPAQSSLPERELEALTDYHRSMAAAAPFIAITARVGSHIAGEVTRGALVTVRASPRSVPAVITGDTWSVDLPAGFPEQFVIEATSGGRTTTLDPARRAWSTP